MPVRDLVYQLVRMGTTGAVTILLRGRCWGRRHVPTIGPVILASNHQSYLDPMLVGCYVTRVLHYLARDSLFDNRWFGAMIRYFNAMPVRRGGADVAAFRQSIRLLERGDALVVFPESTRSRSGRVNPMQRGVIALARRTGARIVPVAIEGAFEIWPRDARWPRPGRVWLEYGSPLDPTQLEGVGDQQGAETLTRIIRDLHNRLRRRAGRPPFDYATAPNETSGDSSGPDMQGRTTSMAEPIHGTGPIVIQESAGKKAYCQCGHSANLPYCDGSHARRQTGLAPIVCEITETRKVAICQCHQSGKLPFCDGTHNKL